MDISPENMTIVLVVMKRLDIMDHSLILPIEHSIPQIMTSLLSLGFSKNNHFLTHYFMKPLPPERTRCEIYTRVMGYYRPVSQFNHGKKSEFYSRWYYSESRSLTSPLL